MQLLPFSQTATGFSLLRLKIHLDFYLDGDLAGVEEVDDGSKVLL